MKKIVALLVLLPMLCLADGARTFSVTNSSELVCADRSRFYFNEPNWVTSTAYVNGNTVTNAGSHYMALSAGTSGATAPTHNSGAVSDGTVDWLYIPMGAETKPLYREDIVFIVMSGGPVSFNVGTTAVLNTGITLPTVNSSWSPGNVPQEEIHVIDGNIGSVISVYERSRN